MPHTNCYDLIITHTHKNSEVVLNSIHELFESLKKQGLIHGWDIEYNQDLTEYVRNEYGEE